VKSEDMSIEETVKAISNNEFTTEEVLERKLSRIKSIDEQVNALVSCNPEKVLQNAKEVDTKINSGDSSALPLAGISIACKDNICVEGYSTTCGSKALENTPSPYTATVVEKTIQNGGVVIGKSNLDEFGLGSTTLTSEYGCTCNPLALDRVAGDGSAAAVASGQAMIGIATDAGGAVRQSATYCGVAGLRPTAGAVSRYGVALSTSSVSQVGFISKYVNDFNILMELLAGFDPCDSSTVDFPGVLPFDKKEKLVAGIPEKTWEDMDKDQEIALQSTRDLLNTIGIELSSVNLPNFKAGLKAYYILALAEAYSNLSRFDGIRFGYHYDGGNLEDWYLKTRGKTFGEEAKRRVVMGANILKEGNFYDYYQKALQVWTLVKNDFYRALKNCDFLVLPVNRDLPTQVSENINFLEHYKRDEYCAPVSLAGLPSISMPIVEKDNLPRGVQLVGKPFQEKLLVSIATELEARRSYSLKSLV